MLITSKDICPLRANPQNRNDMESENEHTASSGLDDPPCYRQFNWWLSVIFTFCGVIVALIFALEDQSWIGATWCLLAVSWCWSSFFNDRRADFHEKRADVLSDNDHE